MEMVVKGMMTIEEFRTQHDELMYKDIGLFNTTAKELNVPAFFGQATAQVWNIPIAEAGGKADCIEVQKTYERWSGTKMCGIAEEKQRRQIPAQQVESATWVVKRWSRSITGG